MKIKYLYINSHAEWGKDTLAGFLSEHLNIVYRSSSLCICDHLGEPLVKKYGYKDYKSLWYHKNLHRAELFNLVQDYVGDDPAKFSELVFSTEPIYVGVRRKEELAAFQERYPDETLTIWVDASERKPEEPKSSMTVTKDQSDIIVDNNGTLDQLKVRAKRLAQLLKPSLNLS